MPVSVQPIERETPLRLRVHGAAPTALFQISTTARRVFDLAADPPRIALAFQADRLLEPLIRQRPGVRIPGAWDPFECAVRALLGEQTDPAGARALTARLVERLGDRVADGDDGLTHLFPTPQAIAAADLESPGVSGGNTSSTWVCCSPSSPTWAGRLRSYSC